MIINKITIGYVIQSFDTEKQSFVSQEFISGENCALEDQEGVEISEEFDIPYLPFEMVQPLDKNDNNLP